VKIAAYKNGMDFFVMTHNSVFDLMYVFAFLGGRGVHSGQIQLDWVE